MSDLNCLNPDCQISTTGSCAENHPSKEACPNYNNENDTNIDIDIDYDDDREEGYDESNTHDRIANTSVDINIKVYSGDSLTETEASDLLRERPAKIIVLMGDSGSGKSTFIQALYELFQRGTLGDFLFSSSKTLLGFDKRSFYSRLSSGQNIPSTPRTSISDGLRYFHLVLKHRNDLSNSIDILLSDRAGEKYKQSRNSPSLASDLHELYIADKIFILMDGEKIANKENRTSASNVVRQNIRLISDNIPVNTSNNIKILITKFDIINTHPNKDDILDYLSKYKERLSTEFTAKNITLEFYYISSRDPSGQMPLAYGLDKLITEWPEDNICTKYNTILDNSIQTSREIDNFIFKVQIEGV